ncbi:MULTISPECIES: photosystem II assembly family protein [unclassified Prochlorococcus]|uniref:photosystem II assembly family protein n=1 Tax=unclassified Prochlorococcus TaxID=2627481 RepID=UPI0039A46AB0
MFWFAFFASACIGLLTMGLRASSGSIVPLSDLFIQIGALLLTGGLLWIDRRRGT